MDIFALIPQFGGVIWTIIFFIVALSVIVAIHEYGHYIVGRWSGIHADVFSLGFGPILWSGHDKRGTRWQIAALPFGGFVKFAGDANAASGKNEAAMEAVAADPKALRRTMHGAPLWARALTVAAGPAFNFALSILIFALLAMNTGQIKEPTTVAALAPHPLQERCLQPGDILISVAGQSLQLSDGETYQEFTQSLPLEPQITYQVERDGREIDVTDIYYFPPLVGGVQPQSAAIAAGLEPGDLIQAVDGQEIFAFQQLREVVIASEGRALDLTVWRDGEVLQKTLSAKRVDMPSPDGGFETNWLIGIFAGELFEPETERLGVVPAIVAGGERIGSIVSGSLSGLWHMVAGNISSCNLSGPVGIAQVSGQMASQGTLNFINFIAVLSVAVGLLNLFPVPALDGGHLVFYAYEAVTGRPPSDGALRILMTVGLAMVLSLMFFALYNDLFCP